MFILNKFKVSALCIAILTSSNAFADDPYQFDWNSSKDMSGAFFMCGLTAFTWTDGANCPRVLLKCMTDPSLLRWTWKGPKSKCLNLFAFFSSGEEALQTISDAANLAGTDTETIVGNVISHVDGVLETTEQDSDPDPDEYEDYIEGGYSNTVYLFAEQATEAFADSDYFDFYYTGNAEGEGGWGHPDYERNTFEADIFDGTSAEQAYQSGYDDSFVEPDYADHVTYFPPDDELITITDTMTDAERVSALQHNEDVRTLYREQTETANQIIDQENEALHQTAIANAISGALVAKENQQLIIDSAYQEWRSLQPWNNFGYEMDAFESNYNIARVEAFYNAFIAAGSSPDCDTTCATNAAETAAEAYSVSS